MNIASETLTRLREVEASIKRAEVNGFEAIESAAYSLARAYHRTADDLKTQREVINAQWRADVGTLPFASLANELEIRLWSQQRADEATRIAEQSGTDEMMQTAAMRSHWYRWGLPPPDLTAQRTAEGVMMRLQCRTQWRSKARREWMRLRERQQIEAGKVHKQAGLYVSGQGFGDVVARRDANREMLEKMIAISDEGDAIDLIDAIDASLANPKNRRIDTMDWAGAIDKIAELRGDVAMFETLTASSKWHAHTWNQKAVRRNPKWEAIGCPMPDETQKHMAEQWDGAMRKLRRKKIGWYGMRTVQPHHDGTPHWHVLIFCKPEHVSAIHYTLREFFLKDEPDEQGADERRVVLKMIDRSKGSAVGYVARYIARAIDGSDCRDLRERDDEGVMRKTANDSITGAQRCTAWASLWGIRMFQFFGLPSKLWARELRRLRNHKHIEKAPIAEGQGVWSHDLDRAPVCKNWFMEQCRDAADRADFSEFIDLTGGPMTPRKLRPLATFRQPTARKNRYMEPRPDSVQGVQLAFVFTELPPVFGPEPQHSAKGLIGFAIPPAPLPESLRRLSWDSVMKHRQQKAIASELYVQRAAAFVAPVEVTRPREWSLMVMPEGFKAADYLRAVASEARDAVAFDFGGVAAPRKTVNNCSDTTDSDIAWWESNRPNATVSPPPKPLHHPEYLQ